MIISFEQIEDILTVKPEGELDSLSAPEFEKQVREHISGAGHFSGFNIDLEKVDYVSSAGIRVILALIQDPILSSSVFKLINANEHITEVFDMVGLLDIITIE